MINSTLCTQLSPLPPKKEGKRLRKQVPCPRSQGSLTRSCSLCLIHLHSIHGWPAFRELWFLANYVQKVFACRKGCGDQQNQPGKKRLKLLLNGGAGGLLTAPAQRSSFSGDKVLSECRALWTAPGPGWRCWENWNSHFFKNIHPVTLGLVTSFLSFNLHKLCQVRTFISRCHEKWVEEIVFNYFTSLWLHSLTDSLTHSLIQQILSECLLCASSGDTAMNKAGKAPVLMSEGWEQWKHVGQ